MKPNLTRILQENYGTVCLVNKDRLIYTPRILKSGIKTDEMACGTEL